MRIRLLKIILTAKRMELNCWVLHPVGFEKSISKRLEFVSNRMSYIILRGRWCDIIALNVHHIWVAERRIDGTLMKAAS
jgi:hypothetical protein